VRQLAAAFSRGACSPLFATNDKVAEQAPLRRAAARCASPLSGRELMWCAKGRGGTSRLLSRARCPRSPGLSPFYETTCCLERASNRIRLFPDFAGKRRRAERAAEGSSDSDSTKWHSDSYSTSSETRQIEYECRCAESESESECDERTEDVTTCCHLCGRNGVRVFRAFARKTWRAARAG